MEEADGVFQYIADHGYFPSQNDYPGIQGTLYDAANAWPRGPGHWRSDRGYSSSGAPALAAPASPIMVSNGVPAGVTGGGTVTRHAGVPWAAGNGTAVEGATVLGAVSGQLMVYVGGSLIAAGLAAPSAPSIAASATASGKMNGSYSVAVAAYRNTTGALSSRSAPSAALTVKNKKITVTLPAAPSGATHWVFYGSRRGFGSVGPWFRITTIGLTTVAVGTLTFDVDWFDGELGDIAGINFDPPPSGVTHCSGLGGSMIALGPGGRVSPSLVGFPEAFPPEFTTFIGSREAITGVTARSTEGVIFVTTTNSLNALVPSGNVLVPAIPRGLWENTGFASGSAFCLVLNQIYGMAGNGPVRTHGGEDPDQSFAKPVLQYMLDNGWNSANTVVTHAPDNHCVTFAKGATALNYMLAGEEEGTWSAPITIPSATAGVTVNGVGYVASGSSLVALDKSGGSSSAAFLLFPFYGDDIFKTIRYVKVSTVDSVTIDLINYRTGASIGSPFPTTVSGPSSAWIPCNNIHVTGLACKVTFSAGGGKRWRNTVVEYLADPMHVAA